MVRQGVTQPAENTGPGNYIVERTKSSDEFLFTFGCCWPPD